MAHKVKNKKGFLIIAMTKEEACILGFGLIEDDNWIIIDDNTNKEITDVCYYVSVLNKVFSKNSCKNWLNRATRYDEDIPYEKNHFNFYYDLLKNL